MATYQLNIALWQIPTMVVSDRGSDAATTRERQMGNVVGDMTIDHRMTLLEKRVQKAATYFATQPAPDGARVVTVFAAPEYLFADASDSHFISQGDKDRLLGKLKDMSKRHPNIVFFPGTVAWKKPARRSGFWAKTFLPSREKQAKKRIESFSNYHTGSKKRFNTMKGGDANYWLAENTCYVMHDGKTLLKYHKRNDGGETNRTMDGADVFWIPGPRDPFFTHNGLDFGLQICAEMGSELAQTVDLQVAISASHPLREGKLKLRPGGYACHADAAIAPRVVCNDPAGGITEIAANVRRRGGGGISEGAARALATTHMSADKIEEQTTVLRGRSRYYVLSYDKA